MKNYCPACKNVPSVTDEDYCPVCYCHLEHKPITIGELCLKLLAIAAEIGEDKLVTIEGCDCCGTVGSVRVEIFSSMRPEPSEKRAFIGRTDR
jgi:hypothetical protein